MNRPDPPLQASAAQHLQGPLPCAMKLSGCGLASTRPIGFYSDERCCAPGRPLRARRRRPGGCWPPRRIWRWAMPRRPGHRPPRPWSSLRSTGCTAGRPGLGDGAPGVAGGGDPGAGAEPAGEGRPCGRGLGRRHGLRVPRCGRPAGGGSKLRDFRDLASHLGLQ